MRRGGFLCIGRRLFYRVAAQAFLNYRATLFVLSNATVGVQFNGLLDGTTKSEQTDRRSQQAADKNHGCDVHVLGGH